MFSNLQDCDSVELTRQMNYLSATPVAGIVALLRDGRCLLKKGIVSTLSNLGTLKTEFGEIGSLVPPQRGGEHKFLVSEIVPLLRANRHIPDGDLLRKIESIMGKEARNEIEFNVTVFSRNGEAIVKDGNKRTIAFFENRRQRNNAEINYEVYLVVPQ